jgi:hypothetical protein
MTGAEYQLCGSIEPNTGHLPASLGAFLQPNSRVCRSSNASAVAYSVEQYFIVRRSRPGIRSSRSQSNSLARTAPVAFTGQRGPIARGRSNSRLPSSRDKSFGPISDDLRSYPSERATGSLRSFLLNLHNLYATITCVCQARIQRRVLMSIPRPETSPAIRRTNAT